MRRGSGVKIAAWAVVIASAVLAVAFSTRFGSDPGLSASPLIGQQAPDVVVPTLDGNDEVSLSDIDAEVVVVNFFASWCLECRTEHADLVATANAWSARNVRFVQIAYDDRPVDTEAFLDELGRSPETLYLTDQESRAAIAFGVRGVPETFFIDASGVVQGKISGESNALLLSETIDTMLSGGTPGEQTVGEVQTRD